jgi:hypothetical protein
MDAVILIGKIRTKQLSPTEVTKAVLARIEKLPNARHSAKRRRQTGILLSRLWEKFHAQQR